METGLLSSVMHSLLRKNVHVKSGGFFKSSTSRFSSVRLLHPLQLLFFLTRPCLPVCDCMFLHLLVCFFSERIYRTLWLFFFYIRHSPQLSSDPTMKQLWLPLVDISAVTASSCGIEKRMGRLHCCHKWTCLFGYTHAGNQSVLSFSVDKNWLQRTKTDTYIYMMLTILIRCSKPGKIKTFGSIWGAKSSVFVSVSVQFQSISPKASLPRRPWRITWTTCYLVLLSVPNIVPNCVLLKWLWCWGGGIWHPGGSCRSLLKHNSAWFILSL